MLLYIIRHGDPIYEPDSLTEKGKLQAQALAKRLAVHGLDRIYSSPMVRAQMTAEPTCQLLGIPAQIEEWTSENLAWETLSVLEPDGRRHWCFQIQNTLLKNDQTLHLGADWHRASCFREDYRKPYQRICDASDEFLARHGYRREGAVYRIVRPSEERIALFCHQGFGLTWMSHLLQIPPHIFWSSFDVTHSGVSIFRFENYADGFTNPRCLCFSDTSHIYREGLPLQFENRIDI